MVEDHRFASMLGLQRHQQREGLAGEECGNSRRARVLGGHNWPAALAVFLGQSTQEIGSDKRLLLVESHLTFRLFGSMLRRMEALPLPAG